MSVRTPEEAVAALEGGATIIDVKEPAHGPLGMASVEVIFAIASTTHALARIPVSAALGEVLDWRDQPIPVLPPHLQWAKLGLAGMATEPHWIALWQAVRNEFDVLRGQPLEWVAVAYADHAEARSPAPDVVLKAAIETGCRVFLIDTWNKHGGRMIDLLSVSQLRELAAQARAAGVQLALAGRVELGDLPTLRQCHPDILAVRGAACLAGQREAVIDSARVAELVAVLEQDEPVSIPKEINVEINGVTTAIPSGSTVAQLLASLQKNPKFLAVERNRELVPRTQHAECVLAAGDQIEIVTLVGGG